MRTLFILGSLMLFSVAGLSQQKNINDQIKGLQVNSSPAYVVLGVEPENIQRPNSPSEFVASVQSANVNGQLAPNFALETTPFLWNKKPDDSTRFNVVEYMTNRSVGANFIRSLTFSFATSPADSTIFSEAFQGTALAFGAHFQLIPGKISAEVRDNLLAWFHTSRLDNVIDAMLLDLNSSADAEIEDVDLWLDDQLETGSFAKLSDLNKDVIRNLLHLKLKKNKLTQKDIVMLTRIQGSLDKKAKLQLTNINKFKFPLTREGFMLEGAVAHAKIATEGTWKKLEGAKTSFWLTPSYRFNINKDPERVDFV
ncbi:MAG TPA: hypothetical protein VGD31_02955, partial [Sphingobacteriaceae bacterium]